MNIQIQTDSQNHSKIAINQKENFPPLSSKSKSKSNSRVQKLKSNAPQMSNEIQKYQQSLKILLLLAKKMDQVHLEHYNRQQNRQNSQMQDQKIIKIKKELQKQEKKKKNLKKKHNQKLRKLQSNYDQQKHVGNSNELKYLNKILQEALQQKKYLQKILKSQRKAVQEEADRSKIKKINQLEVSLKQQTNKNRQKLSLVNQNNKKIIRLQTQYTDKVKYYQLIKQRIKNYDQQKVINQSDIAKLQLQFNEIEQQRIKFEKVFEKQIHQLQIEKKQLQKEIQLKEILLNHKRKQDKIAECKLKYIKKLCNPIMSKNISCIHLKTQFNQEKTYPTQPQNKRPISHQEVYITEQQQHEMIEDDY